MAKNIKAVIFDMDGTIVAPLLDFPRMKAEIGLPQDKGLLESMSQLDETGRNRAEEVLHAHELAAARTCHLNPGVREAMDALASMGIKAAILTRNSRRSTTIVCERHNLVFDAVVTREDCLPKPDPDGVLSAARQMGVRPDECIMVGDYEYDIRAGREAGATTVLFSPDGKRFATESDFTITSMEELPPIVADLDRA